MFDVIVFSQRELMRALKGGVRSVGLCDNSFVLPAAEGVRYTAIGNVSARIKCTAADAAEAGIEFDGFLPKFGKRSIKKRYISSGLGGYGTELI